MCRTFNCRGIIGHSALWGALIASAFNANAEVKKTSLEKTTQSEEEITVVAPVIENKSGTITTITAQDMQKKGGNDFGSIMRYEPLISATGVSGLIIGEKRFRSQRVYRL